MSDIHEGLKIAFHIMQVIVNFSSISDNAIPGQSNSAMLEDATICKMHIISLFIFYTITIVILILTHLIFYDVNVNNSFSAKSLLQN